MSGRRDPRWSSWRLVGRRRRKRGSRRRSRPSGGLLIAAMVGCRVPALVGPPAPRPPRQPLHVTAKSVSCRRSSLLEAIPCRRVATPRATFSPTTTHAYASGESSSPIFQKHRLCLIKTLL